MPDAGAMEAQADQLRECARDARVKAQALATHLDALSRRAADESLWKGPYPTQARTTLDDWVSRLGSAADLLNADADAWDRCAAGLDQDAQDARAEEREKEPTGGG